MPYAAPASPRFFDDPENAFLRDRRGKRCARADFATARFETFDSDLWWSFDPRYALPSPEPGQFSIEITRSHIQRATDVVNGISAAYAAYEAFMRWEDPKATGAAFVLFVACCVLVDADYAGALPLIAFCATLLALARHRFLDGDPRRSYFDAAFSRADEEHLGGGATRYRPLGYVKVAVCAGRSIDAAPQTKKKKHDHATKPTPGDIFVVATFRHHRAFSPMEAPPKASPQPAQVPRSESRDSRPGDSPSGRRKSDSAASSPRGTLDGDDGFFSTPERTLDALFDADDLLLDGGGGAGAPGEEPEAPRDDDEGDGAPDDGSERSTSSSSDDDDDDDDDEVRYDEHVLGYTGTARGTCEPRWHGALGATLDHRVAGPSALLSRLVGTTFGTRAGPG